MKTTLTALWMLGLCFGCHKQEAAQGEPAAPTTNATTAPTSPEPAPEAKVELQPSKIKAFAGYLDKRIDMMRESKTVLAEFNKKSQAGKYDGVVGAGTMLNDHLAAGQKLQEREDALRKEYNLNEREIHAFGEIEAAVVVRASPLVTQMSTAVTELEKSLATASEAVRPQLESSLAELKAARDKQLSLKEVRDEYGDAIVDAMLAEQATWVRLDNKLTQP